MSNGDSTLGEHIVKGVVSYMRWLLIEDSHTNE